LRVRCGTCELHHRQRGRGKQYETKVYHDGGPRKVLGRGGRRKGRRRTSRRTDQQLTVGPHCGGPQNGNAHYFIAAMGCMHTCSLRVQMKAANPDHKLFRSWCSDIGRRVRWGWSVRPTHRKFIRQLAGQLVRARRLPRVVRWGRHLRARIAGRNSGRWLGRSARRCRWNFGRFSRHQRQRRRCSDVPQRR
jgi:hypothetical protein